MKFNQLGVTWIRESVPQRAQCIICEEDISIEDTLTAATEHLDKCPGHVIEVEHIVRGVITAGDKVDVYDGTPSYVKTVVKADADIVLALLNAYKGSDIQRDVISNLPIAEGSIVRDPTFGYITEFALGTGQRIRWDVETGRWWLDEKPAT